MKTTKHVTINGVQITLYTLDGRNWFSSPVSLVETRKRRRAIGDGLRQSWKRDVNKLDAEFATAGGDLGGEIKL